MWHRIVIAIAHVATKTVRFLGFNGSSLPGLIAERLAPNMLASLSEQLPQGVVVVTGTNGKTTTAKILRHLLEARGLRVLANRSGSNFTRGVTASFVQHAGFDGQVRYDIAVMEIDEAYTPQLSKLLKPRQLVALNVMRDQLDRYGEIDRTAEMIGSALEYCQSAVLNADDPPVAGLSTYAPADASVSYFGAAAEIKRLLPSDEELIGEQKPRPDASTKQSADVMLTSIKGGEDTSELKIQVNGKSYISKFNLEGVHNAINATAAIASINQLFGLKTADIEELSRVRPAFGRGERIVVEGVPVHLALVKNPGGFNQNVRSFVKEHVGVFLIAINDRYADGRDVSWLWDVDLAKLPKEGRYIVSGVRAYDMALRLQYEDIYNVKINTNLRRAVKLAIADTPKDTELLVLPTYTAMLEIRKILAKKTEAHEIWR